MRTSCHDAGPAGEDTAAAFTTALRAASERESHPGIILRLEDDLSNVNPADYKDAKGFRAFCPVSALPALVILSPGGTVQLKLEGVFPEDGNAQIEAVLAKLIAELGRTSGASVSPSGNDAQGPRAIPPAVEGPFQPEQASPASVAASGAPAHVPQEPPSSEPAQIPVTLSLKLPDGSVLRREYGPDTTLGEVFSDIDAARVNAPGGTLPYVLLSSQPRAQWGADAAGSTLSELGVSGRTMLSIVPNPSGHAPPAPIMQQAAVSAVAGKEPGTMASASSMDTEANALAQPMDVPVTVPLPEAPVKPSTYLLQLKLPNGQALRAGFAPEAPLAEVAAYLDAHRTGTVVDRSSPSRHSTGCL